MGPTGALQRSHGTNSQIAETASSSHGSIGADSSMLLEECEASFTQACALQQDDPRRRTSSSNLISSKGNEPRSHASMPFCRLTNDPVEEQSPV